MTVAAIVLSVSAAAFGFSCGSGGPAGPPESAVLEEVTLTFPGAVEASRSFLAADNDTGIDGNDLSNDARLTRRLQLSTGDSDGGAIRSWYAEHLEKAGWTRGVGSPESVSFRKTADGIEHVYRVAAPDGPVSAYAVVYVMYFVDRD